MKLEKKTGAPPGGPHTTHHTILFNPSERERAAAVGLPQCFAVVRKISRKRHLGPLCPSIAGKGF